MWTILDGSDPRWGKPYGIFTTLVIVTAILAFAFSRSNIFESTKSCS